MTELEGGQQAPMIGNCCVAFRASIELGVADEERSTRGGHRLSGFEQFSCRGDIAQVVVFDDELSVLVHEAGKGNKIERAFRTEVEMLNTREIGGQGFEEGIVELAKDRLGDLVVRIDGSEKDDRLGDKVFHFGQGHTISELDVVAGNDDSRDAGFEGGFAVIAIVSHVVDQHFTGVERGLKNG